MTISKKQALATAHAKAEVKAVATSTTKANTGGIAGGVVPAIVLGIIKFIEAYWMIDIDLLTEAMILGAVGSTVSYWSVWFFPNKPVED